MGLHAVENGASQHEEEDKDGTAKVRCEEHDYEELFEHDIKNYLRRVTSTVEFSMQLLILLYLSGDSSLTTIPHPDTCSDVF